MKKKKESSVTKRKVASELLSKKLNKLAKKTTTSKRLLRKDQTQVTIPEYRAESVLNDENRFFNTEMEGAKKSMYFS